MQSVHSHIPLPQLAPAHAQTLDRHLHPDGTPIKQINMSGIGDDEHSVSGPPEPDMTQWNRAISSQKFDPLDPYILQRQTECLFKLRRFHEEFDELNRKEMIKGLLGVGPEATVAVRDGFRCEIVRLIS